jgi:hypothetical protein
VAIPKTQAVFDLDSLLGHFRNKLLPALLFEQSRLQLSLSRE